MKSVATRRFWELFDALPVDVQKLAGFWPAGLEDDNVDLDWYPRRV